MSLRIFLTCVAAVALTTITACTGVTPGSPGPAPGTGGSASNENARSTTSPATPTDAKEPLESTDPCSLLTRSEAEQVMGPLDAEPAQEKVGSARVCDFAPNQASLGVGIRTNVGLAGIQPNGGEVKDVTVKRHQAKQLLGATGSCGVYIGVTSSSRVDVVLNAGASTDPCPLALKIAELVEPRLS
ncbi:DUF3558 domain-containing protein [Lentzea sp. NPDC059081]|uniref:DUF3558 domain-containing protein n=1 Tax=Lentzea sp. NPDC059081 TaxID=3346719 RepID=UPI0036A42A2B